VGIIGYRSPKKVEHKNGEKLWLTCFAASAHVKLMTNLYALEDVNVALIDVNYNLTNGEAVLQRTSD
jgi:hypothetical protein